MWQDNKTLPVSSVTIRLVLITAICAVMGVRAAENTQDQHDPAHHTFGATNRPFRNKQELILTVGQSEGDLRGQDDKIIQAGIEYLHRLGGGTLRILPGVYDLHNAIHLRPCLSSATKLPMRTYGWHTRAPPGRVSSRDIGACPVSGTNAPQQAHS